MVQLVSRGTAMLPTERTCPRCSHRTTRPTPQCPKCGLPSPHRERAWTPSRRGPRIPLPPGVWGELNARLKARVLDLSSGGARLEHHGTLRPDHLYSLTLLLGAAEGPLRLPVRVVWSQVYQFEPGGDMVYHSGVEFRDPAPEAKQYLTNYLAALNSGRPESSSPVAPPALDQPPRPSLTLAPQPI